MRKLILCIVIKMGDNTVVGMMSYMRLLSTFDVVDQTKVIIKQDDIKIEEEITFVENKIRFQRACH